MFNTDYAGTVTTCREKYSTGQQNVAEAVACWFIVDNLRTQYPLVDTTLAKIYFRTYGIPIGNDPADLQEALNEYEADILRFFLCNQRQRCMDVVVRVSKLMKNNSVILPVQCKQFINEMLNLNATIGTHNAFTKETEVLDSLRDTIIGNSLDPKYITYAAGAKMTSNTTGQYILNSYEVDAYLKILTAAVDELYDPLFGIKGRKRPLYALTETYEDSGTRFMKVVDYLKAALFMVCTSLDTKGFSRFPEWLSPHSAVPSLQDDMFEAFKAFIRCGDYKETMMDKIASEASEYGGLSLTHAICLPHGNNVVLDTDRLKKNANSLTYKFLVCQEYLSCIPATMPGLIKTESDIGGPCYA